MFGLTPRDFKLLMQIILNHQSTLRRVILFGSRARGDHRAHSDRESIKQGMISDDSSWFDMIEKRNDSTHTYHHDIAIMVYTTVKTTFIGLLSDFEGRITRMIESK